MKQLTSHSSSLQPLIDEVSSSPSRRRVQKRVALLTLAGLVLLACNLQGQYLLLPYWLEEIGRVFYKASFFIVLPFRGIVCVLIPSVEHHWTLAHHAVTCLGAPFFLAGLAWLARAAFRRLRRRRAVAPTVDPSALDRRQFLMRTTAGVVGIATGSVGGYASILAPESVRLRQYELPIAGLAGALDGLRIVHISDTHYGPFVAMPYLEKVFDKANALRADLVVLTGDYVHYAPQSVEPGIGVLSRLRARFGVVAVLGNHEHWEGTDLCQAQFKNIGVPLLDNRNLFLTSRGLREDAIAGQSICLAGVGDLWEDEVSFEKALAGVPADMPRLLLSHNPDTAEMIGSDQRVDLMFSGHTHGGQISLPLIGAPISPSRFGDKYLGGMCVGPRCGVLVSRGVGMAGVPVRVGVPPELGLITLRRA